MLYISQLFETNKLKELLQMYPVGLEVISFSIGSVLDCLEESIDYYREDFKEIKAPLLFHGPFMDLNPGSCDTRIIELVRDRVNCCAQASEQFKATGIVFHTGFVPKTYPEQYWLENAVSFWEHFLKEHTYTEEIYIENVLEQDPYIVKELVDRMNQDRVKICLDIGHAHAHSQTAVMDWIKVLGSRIQHVHLHNNDGIEDSHKGLLNGSIEIHNIMEALITLSEPKHYTLEMSNEKELHQSIEWLSKQRYLNIVTRPTTCKESIISLV